MIAILTARRQRKPAIPDPMAIRINGIPDRPRDGRRGHRAVPVAEEAGGRAATRRRSVLRDQRPETFEKLAGSFDLVLNTVSAALDVSAYLSLLAVDGALVNVGAPPEPLSVNVFSLIMGRRSFAGSMIGGIRETQEMLDFCAEHQLGAEIEVIGADQINEAYERVLASDVRYRFVIDTSTLS